MWICQHCSMFYFQVFTESGQQIPWSCWECGEEDGNPVPAEPHWPAAQDSQREQGMHLQELGGLWTTGECMDSTKYSINTEHSNQILSHWNYLIGLSSWTESFVSAYQGFLFFFCISQHWHLLFLDWTSMSSQNMPRIPVPEGSRVQDLLLQRRNPAGEASHPGCHPASATPSCTGTSEPQLSTAHTAGMAQGWGGTPQLHPQTVPCAWPGTWN